MIRQLFISLDQFINVWLFWWLPGGVWADETLSAKAWRTRDINPRLHFAIDLLFFWEEDHCRLAYEIEMARHDMPPEFRNKV
jgi:hypothetical protein